MPTDVMDQIVNLAKRRGFAFQSSEIYGGLRSSYDYGPLGVELKNNIKRAWWRSVVQLRDDVVGQDSAIIMSPRVWEASGHLESFADPLVECTNCHQRFREDHLVEAFEAKHGRKPERGELTCPNCGKGPFTDPRNFNLMFKTFMGPVEDESAVVWLRPETAQGIFVDFPTVQSVSRKKIPFGIAQIGKAFRNEITPGNFIFRTREFEQMELEYFVRPGTDEEWHQRWIDERFRWYQDLGIRQENLRLREHGPDELAHYAKRAVDVEYKFPFGWSELEGIANRSDFDLTQHQKFSGQDLTYFDQESNSRYIPYVVEPSAGADRSLLAFLADAYREEEAPTALGGTESRVVLRLDKRLAPMKVAVLPLSRNERLVPLAREVSDKLRDRWMIDYDDARSIGRRYRRQDEVGTPYCVTVDFDSLEDRSVTVRDRDSMRQDRVSLDNLVGYLAERLPACGAMVVQREELPRVLAVEASGPGAAPGGGPALSPLDLALVRGEAAFETMRVYRGRPFRLDAHLERLAVSAAGLDLALPHGLPGLAARALASSGVADGVLRLVCTRGIEGDFESTAFAIVSELPPEYELERHRGLRLVLLTLAVDPLVRAASPWLLPGIKSTSYAVNMAAQRQARRMGADDAVFVGLGGELLEGPTANLWWRAGETLYTPSLELGILAGITRLTVMELAAAGGYRVVEGVFTAEDLAGAEEAFTSSSTREIMPVATVDGHPVGAGASGPAAAALQAALRAAAAA